jgi:hypothetical protein
MSVLRTSLACALLVAASACGKEKAAPEPPASVPASASAPPTVASVASAAPSASAAPDDTPPTEEKADRKAAREITNANYKAELTKIEKEIGAP